MEVTGMESVFDGVMKFYEEDYNKHKSFYEGLRENKPHILFISCVDARVDPNRLVQAKPGELYAIRNLGNIIPPYDDPKSSGSIGTTSAIEYAVCVLNIKTIIICGHNNCGACRSIYRSEEELASLPHVKKWLEFMHPVRDKVLALNPDSITKRQWITELLNVQYQMQNLLTYPFISERFDRGALQLFGWYYTIDSGEILNYNPITREFKPITPTSLDM
ncbi:carbonic anhydrase [Helicobacter sp. 13S00401-1]|uniref:carbonic anhydrase n=1 Tax=Helicobacter sp. 13S00401-1 TaxID=1905758 RepID=UPI00209C04E8|nr:carbonic anhydrase [Helicobacter sp. 13S00401-1]